MQPLAVDSAAIGEAIPHSDGDAVADIRARYHVAQVFKGRRLYYAPDLLRAEGVSLRRG